MSIQVRTNELRNKDPQVVQAMLTNKTCWWEFRNEQGTWIKRILGTWFDVRRSARSSYIEAHKTNYGIIVLSDYELVK